MSSRILLPVLPPADPEALAELDDQELRLSVRQRADQALALCHTVHPDLPSPEIWFDLRGKGAGQAHFGRGGLRFNPQLLSENRQAFIDEVVPHEMAHWLVWHLQDGPSARPHGHEWRTVMRRLFGLTPSVTHRFDTARASPAPHLYRCECREHGFSARRHANAQAGREYRCRACHASLRHVGSA